MPTATLTQPERLTTWGPPEARPGPAFISYEAPALPARHEAHNAPVLPDQGQIAQLVSSGYDPRALQHVADRAQRAWKAWQDLLAPQDVPQPLGLGVYPDLPRANTGPTSDVVLLEAASHPLVRRGAFYLPEAEWQRLQRLVQAGVDPLILVLDELPTGTVRRYGLEAISRDARFFLPPPAPSTLALNERLGRRAAFLNRVFGWAAEAVVAVMLTPLLLSGLDPAVLGVIGAGTEHPRPGEPVFVFVLSAWRW